MKTVMYDNCPICSHQLQLMRDGSQQCQFTLKNARDHSKYHFLTYRLPNAIIEILIDTSIDFFNQIYIRHSEEDPKTYFSFSRSNEDDGYHQIIVEKIIEIDDNLFTMFSKIRQDAFILE